MSRLRNGSVSNASASLLLIGANGMLGRAWRAWLDTRGISFVGLTRKELDVTDSSAVEQAITEQYQWVINCSGYTAVDQAEQEEEKATALNGTAVGTLANRCQAVGAKFLHYSTDYVFDGTASSPYATDHPRHPLNAYGRSKCLGEQLIEQSGCSFLMIRTSWLYAPWSKNFVLTMANLMADRSQLKVVDDQLGRPTSCQHLAATSWALMEQGALGLFHVTDGGLCSWFAFASQIAKLIQTSCQVAPCCTEAFPTPAKRPAYSVLDLSQTESRLGKMPSWQENLEKVLKQVKS